MSISIVKRMEKLNANAIRLYGLDSCIAGICETYEGVRFLYSEKAIINHYTNKGMTESEAVLHFENNILPLNSGEFKPIFLMDLEDN